MKNQGILSVILPISPGFGVEAVRQVIRIFEDSFEASAYRDYELILVTNQDLEECSRLVSSHANLQLYGIVGNLSLLDKLRLGVENAIGDKVMTFDPEHASFEAFPLLLNNVWPDDITYFSAQPRTRRLMRHLYYRAFAFFHGLDLEGIASGTRLLSRRTVNYLLQHPEFDLAWKTLPSQLLLPSRILYLASPPISPEPPLLGKISESLSLLVYASNSPLQAAGVLCLLGAVFNFGYGLYVASWFLAATPSEGWTTLSLQQAGTGFILCLTLWLFAEHMQRRTRPSPSVIEKDQTSDVLSRKKRLNVEEEHA